jgi:hypothetical protein
MLVPQGFREGRYETLALQDLLAGRIDFYFADMSALPQVQAGTIKALAVTSRKRLSATPEIPAVDESGLPELFQECDLRAQRHAEERHQQAWRCRREHARRARCRAHAN